MSKNKMTIKNDQTYIDKVLKGDSNAYAFLVEKYKVMVYSLAYKMLVNREEAEEVSGDVNNSDLGGAIGYKNMPSSGFTGDATISTQDADTSRNNQYAIAPE